MAVTVAHIDNWLKIRYEDGKNYLDKQLISAGESPLMKMVKAHKMTTEGKDWTFPIRASQKRTAGRDIAAVFGNVDGSAQTSLKYTMKHNMVSNFDYGIIDRQAMLQSSSNSGTFYEEVADQINQTLIAMNDVLVDEAYGGGVQGSLGRISSTAPVYNSTADTVTFTLDDPADSKLIEPNMVIEVAAAKYTSPTDARRKITVSGVDIKQFVVSKVNNETGEVVVASSVNPSFAAQDYIFAVGNYLRSGDLSPQLQGLIDYAPVSIASNDSFLGLNRSVSPRRLAGLYKAAPAKVANVDVGSQIYDEIVRGVVDTLINFKGYKFDFLVANPKVLLHFNLAGEFRQNVRQMESQGQQKRTALLGFSGFNVATAKGTVPILFDDWCPTNEIFGIKKDDFCVRYLAEKSGSIVNFVKDKGGSKLKDTKIQGKNNMLFTLESYHFFANKLPGAIMRRNVATLLA